MKFKKIILATCISLMAIISVGCTKQTSAKKYGGSYSTELPENKKLVNITWKDDSLWYLVRDMKDDETAEIYQFRESSPYGVFEGEITIKEVKK